MERRLVLPGTNVPINAIEADVDFSTSKPVNVTESK